MSKEIFVFDFDGFLTDPEKTHHAYTRVFEKEFSAKTGISKRVIREHMDLARTEIREHPKLYAWENNEGYKIAPATVDTYFLNKVAAEMAIVTMRESDEKGLPAGPQEVMKLTQDLYFASYPQVRPFYRPEAAGAIKNLYPLGRLLIISNTDPHHLLEKIHPFLDTNNIPTDAVEVVGNAQKFTITPDWERVPRITYFPGLPRPVLLRRGLYGAVILSLGQSPFIIAGDSGEMDLATPGALGFRTLLLETPFSTPWELNVFDHVDSLESVVGQITRNLGR